MGLLTHLTLRRAGLAAATAVLGFCAPTRGPVEAQELFFPPRPATAPTGSELVAQLRDATLEERERVIVSEILDGNVPALARRLVPVTRYLGGRQATTLVVWVAADYLAVGSDDDFVRMPLSPGAAMCVGQRVGAVLPTPALVDAIWDAARLRLGNDSIPPGPAMTTLPVFALHNERIEDRRLANPQRVGTLTAGHKKDVVVVPDLAERPGHVAIYGWHRPTGRPIQPLYTGHTVDWVDYSHGIRFVSRVAERDGDSVDLGQIMSDFNTSLFVSRAGPVDPSVYEVMTGCPAA